MRYLLFFMASVFISQCIYASEANSKQLLAACFNADGLDGEYGIFIREGYKDTNDAIKNDASTLTFIFAPGKSDYAVSELHSCGYLKSYSPHIWLPCESGSFHIGELEPLKSIKGNYSFILRDGSIKKGSVSATYCPKKTGN